MILAADEYGGIGYNNDLPWPRIDLDMRWFMDHTKDNVVVMGSRTWDSLGIHKPLKDRINYVVSSQDFNKFEGAYDSYDPRQYSLESIALSIASRHPRKEIFIIGGKTLYDLAYKFVNKIYLTRVEGTHTVETTVDLEEYLEHFKCLQRIKHVNPYPQPHCQFEIWEKLEHIRQQQDPRHNQWGHWGQPA